MELKVPENTIHYLEIVTTDINSICEIYTKTFGWQFSEMVPELGNARVTKFPNGSLCGIRAPMSADERPIMRNYLRVSDLENSVKKAAISGANILLERMEIPGYGIIAIYEMGGIEQGLWQVL